MAHPRTHRYLLHVDIPATDARVLRDAFEGEPLSLPTRIGDDELKRQLDELQLNVDLETTEPWDDFVRDIEILSTYLAAPVVATELIVGPGVNEVSGSRIIGRGGEVVRVALEVTQGEDGIEITGEDREQLARDLPSFPRWAQSVLAPRLVSEAG